MFVKNHILEKEFLTLVSSGESIKAALDKMEAGSFLSLPVVDDGRFVGYIMKSSVYEDFYKSEKYDKEVLMSKKVSEYMITDVKALDPDDSIDNASYAIEKLNIPFLPVINSDGVFLGIVTHSAIFKAFADLFHIGKGKQIVVYIFNIPGQLSRLFNLFRKEKINVASMVVMDAKVMGILKALVHVEVDDVDSLIELIEKEGFKTGEL